MKKIFIVSAVVTAALAACQKAEITAPSADAPVLYATIEETDSTKTYMDANNNIRWSEGDQIVAFMESALGLKYQIKDEYVGATSGYFSPVSSESSGDIGAGTELSHNILYYPYSSTVRCGKSGDDYALDVVLPSAQSYAPESFGNGIFPMVAVSKSTNFAFKNILGGMKLQLKGTQIVTSITLEGKNNEKLSGVATVTAYTDKTKPAITMSDGASTSVTLDCGSGVQLNESTATEFIIALPPVLFSQGFTVTVTDSDRKTYTVETDKSNEVIRSSLLVMPPVTLGASDEDEPEISGSDYIDEYGINHGKGIEIDGVVWAPVNCGYHETDYAYGKLYQWGRKYGQGYSGNLYDESGNLIGTYSDATTPTIEEGGVSVIAGNDKSNENIFYTEINYVWLDPLDDLWNSGTEDHPVKTEYDPCPEGWRVPTYPELNELCKNLSAWTSEDDQPGYWFSGASSYTDDVPQVFFPAAGYRINYDDGAYYRGNYGAYWSSRPYGNNSYYFLYFDNGSADMNGTFRAFGLSVRCVQDDNELIPVSSLTLDETSLLLNGGETATLSATISPSDANHQSTYWYSENPSIAKVDQNGMVKAVVAGTTNIIAVAGMQTAACEVIVRSSASDMVDYIDEYGVNHGKGIDINGVTWAPVNCGYHETDYAYGKLYQWGRKYGQGYSGGLFDVSGSIIGTYSDATVPNTISGPVDLTTGQSETNKNNFYMTDSSTYNWLSPENDKLWNSGTESKPVKTEYDPCPEGWRVPTCKDFHELLKNLWTLTSEDEQPGYWLSGASSSTDDVPQVFFPAASYRNYDGNAYYRGYYCCYWSSNSDSIGAFSIVFSNGKANSGFAYHAYGFSVRCVLE